MATIYTVRHHMIKYPRIGAVEYYNLSDAKAVGELMVTKYGGMAEVIKWTKRLNRNPRYVKPHTYRQEHTYQLHDDLDGWRDF